MPHVRRRRSQWNCANPQAELEFTSRYCFRRALALESLETRLALSTVTESSLDPCPADLAESEFVESTSAVELSTHGETSGSEQSDFVGPLEVDAYFECISAVEPALATAEGEAASTAPPTLWSFTSDRTAVYWVFTGTVSDDVNPANCRVYFDGILSGQSAAVSPDGTFWHYTLYIPGITATVNAVARDSQGNESNILSVYLVG